MEKNNNKLNFKKIESMSKPNDTKHTGTHTKQQQQQKHRS